MNADFLSAMLSTLFFLLLVPAVTLILFHQLKVIRKLNPALKKLVSVALFLGLVALVLFIKRVFHYESYTYFLYYLLIIVVLSLAIRFQREKKRDENYRLED
jgi:drug/metabolite transporter (DMT)-like permease